MRRDLKFCNESEFLMGCGSEFQSVGPGAAKALSPKVRCLVRRGGVMEGHVVEEEFELDVLLNRQPVELLEDMGVTCFLEQV